MAITPSQPTFEFIADSSVSFQEAVRNTLLFRGVPTEENAFVRLSFGRFTINGKETKTPQIRVHIYGFREWAEENNPDNAHITFGIKGLLRTYDVISSTKTTDTKTVQHTGTAIDELRNENTLTSWKSLPI